MRRGFLKCIFKGQVTLEFLFGIVGVVLLIVGMIHVLGWVGRDIIKRIFTHEVDLVQPVGTTGVDPLQQVQPLFFAADQLYTAVNSDIFAREGP